MKVDVVLGLQWGDEGKGKIVDVLARNYPVICRFQGGPNAGHSLQFSGKSFVLHSVPAGVFRKNTINVIPIRQPSAFAPYRQHTNRLTPIIRIKPIWRERLRANRRRPIPHEQVYLLAPFYLIIYEQQ